MSEKYNNFQSQTAINAQKEENRKARQIILEQAKKNYERVEARKEKAQKQGEGTWMLDSVSQRISKEEKEMKKAKKKKRKKDKKEKKKKKKKVSSDSSSSDSDSEDEKWVESSSKSVSASDVAVKGPQLQRDSWMESPLDLIPTTTRQELRDAAKKQKDEMKREAERMLEPGQHARELNPHWKDGGTGLPEEKPEKKSKALSLPSSGAGDGGLSWLRKSYDRCKQQAQEEGRSLEEVAAERWGSLKKLEAMLAEAEGQHRGRDGRGAGMDRGRGDRSSRGDWDGTGIDRSRGDRRRDDRSEERNRDRERDRRRDSSEERDERRRNRSRDRERGHRDRDKDRGRDSRERQRESRTGGRNGFQRPGSDSDGETRPARSRFMKPDDDSADSERRNRTEKDTSRKSFIKPSDDGNETANRSRFLKPHDSEERRYADKRDDSSSRRFMKPGDERNDKPQDRERHRRRSQTPESSQPRWKKKPVVESQKASGREEEREGKKEKVHEKSRERRRSRSSSSDSSSSSSDSGSDASDSDKQTEEAAPPPKILTEEELNDMAAKILRAEIMGDDDMVADLKSKLEQARKAREAAKSESGTSAPDFCHRRGTVERKRERGKKRRDDEEEEKDNNVVVLSRTSKGGLVRPVLGSSDDAGYGGGKRRKKNVATHDTHGERTKYFDDDDKFDLKTLVEQEKAGTAEDQNSMFARLAGRSTDRDLDMDDMFVSKAAKKQDDEKMATKDMAAAIFEHKKISAAIEKCHRCFDKVPKHLIVAIGTKSYLCLPHHRSLTDGHCLIVPMQHVSAATSMDEDVWQEMQLFRKSLVRMFAAQDQDVVVMETVMHVKHFPHTAIECVPLDKEVGDLSPIYFKKAIQEAGPEWSDNKKLHSLRDKDVRHVIPKGFPYFSVDFGLEGGYATVIEDEATFPPYFGREIVGGMIDAEPTLWRKPHKQSFEDQRQKVLQFEKWWRPFDWTQDLGAGD